ncbi:Hypothetical predicted protein [Mytilus galloprovincialis]|uniref:Uncharacterized protein n=1 Tax=Mytilus galloprovincialis TaxID=29158 RepID=A0A8B6HIG5_MYTGA|nr:Hypothetical predicted protein [Mytilus galloprovincialis]
MGRKSRNPNKQIDQLTICQRWRSSLQDVRAKRGADAESDHHLVIGSAKKTPSKKLPNMLVRQALNIKTGDVTKTEVDAAIKQVKNGKLEELTTYPLKILRQ